jgi:hypothetical protein
LLSNETAPKQKNKPGYGCGDGQPKMELSYYYYYLIASNNATNLTLML